MIAVFDVRMYALDHTKKVLKTLGHQGSNLTREQSE